MPVYLVSYDIKVRNDFEYGPLWEAFKKVPSIRTQLSEWLVASASDQKTIFDYFKAYVHSDDRLMVSTVYDRPTIQQGFKGTQKFLDDFL
jgi:hypothetical protein